MGKLADFLQWNYFDDLNSLNYYLGVDKSFFLFKLEFEF